MHRKKYGLILKNASSQYWSICSFNASLRRKVSVPNQWGCKCRRYIYPASPYLRVWVILHRIGTTTSEHCSNAQTPTAIGIIHALTFWILPYGDFSILGCIHIGLSSKSVHPPFKGQLWLTWGEVSQSIILTLIHSAFYIQTIVFRYSFCSHFHIPWHESFHSLFIFTCFFHWMGLRV